MKISGVSTVAVVVVEPARSRQLFVDTLGLSLEGEGDGYYSSSDLDGCRHFGVWPLTEAAEACFGRPDWPGNLKIPQASIEFEVDDVEDVEIAGAELQRAGYQLLHPSRTEPWGQTVTRLLTGDGLIVGVSYIPAFHGRSS
jgi:catechol 2,3-dioxygenase-like lactoylglutathione lyase family enzyme